MTAVSRLLVPALVVAAAVIVLWPFVDQSATQVSLLVTGFGLILAWYSILDLREQRKERFWPHTTDRLVRATFTAITLVFVVNLVFEPDEPTGGGDPAPPPPPTAQAAFDTAVLEVAKNGTIDAAQLQKVVNEHFGEFRNADGTISMALPDKKRRFTLRGSGSVITVTVP